MFLSKKKKDIIQFPRTNNWQWKNDHHEQKMSRYRFGLVVDQKNSWTNDAMRERERKEQIKRNDRDEYDRYLENDEHDAWMWKSSEKTNLQGQFFDEWICPPIRLRQDEITKVPRALACRCANAETGTSKTEDDPLRSSSLWSLTWESTSAESLNWNGKTIVNYLCEHTADRAGRKASTSSSDVSRTWPVR